MAENKAKKTPGRPRKNTAKPEPKPEDTAKINPEPETEIEKESEKLKSAERQIDILQKMIEELKREVVNKPQNIVQVMADTEKVVLRFQADVADDNVHPFGPNGMYGQVTGKTGIVSVPKAEWSRFLGDIERRLIKKRWLIVLSGLTDDERKIYDCEYREGEVLDEKAFANMVSMGTEMLAVFPKLCVSNQEMVASAYYEAFLNGKVTEKDRNLVLALNEYSKKAYAAEKDGVKKKGAFWPVIEGLNKKSDESAKA